MRSYLTLRMRLQHQEITFSFKC